MIGSTAECAEAEAWTLFADDCPIVFARGGQIACCLVSRRTAFRPHASYRFGRVALQTCGASVRNRQGLRAKLAVPRPSGVRFAGPEQTIPNGNASRSGIQGQA